MSGRHLHKQVLEALNAKQMGVDSWFRYFEVPGMQHCYGSPPTLNAPAYFAGANQAGDVLGPVAYSVPGFQDAAHDALLALMAWTENDTAPASIIATAWGGAGGNDTTEVVRQRPLCPYPQQARYLGNGSVNAASSWECR
jgi:feruloyl esterase